MAAVRSPTPSPAPPAARPTPTATPIGAGELPGAQAVRTPQPHDPASVLGEQVTISLWHDLPPDSKQGRLLGALLGEFQKAYREVTVEATYQGEPGDLHRRVLLAIEEGRPPDLVVGAPSVIAEYARLGAAAALDAYMQDPALGLSAFDLEDILPGPLEAGRYAQFGDLHYAFPFAHQTIALYCNLDLLAAAGHEGPPETIAEMEDAARAVRELDGATGLAMEGSGAIFSAWLLAQGGEQLAEDYRAARFADEVGAAALRRLTRLSAAGALAVLDAPAARDEFARGHVAMLVDSTGSVAVLNRLVSGYRVVRGWATAPLPQGDAGRGTPLLGQTLAILGQTPTHRMASWLLIRFLTDTPQNVRWARAGYLPLRRSAAAALVSDEGRSLAGNVPYELVAPQARAVPNLSCAQEIQDVLGEALVGATEGLVTAEEALGRAADRVEGLLLAGCR